MEPVFMVLGQPAAIAAVHAIDQKVAVQKINVKDLQNHLKSDPLGDGSVADILIDNSSAEMVEISGKCTKEWRLWS